MLLNASACFDIIKESAYMIAFEHLVSRNEPIECTNTNPCLLFVRTNEMRAIFCVGVASYDSH